MNFTFSKKLPTPSEIMEQLPFPKELQSLKEERLEDIKNVFVGLDKRFLLIIGPCSADNEKAVLEYIEKLALVQEKVSDKIIIIPRIYTNKPRTTGEGYKGMVHQPDPEKETDLYEGIKAIRRLHIKALSNYRMPAADEMLYPANYAYLSDLLAYNAIGARSVENQQHRLTASGVSTPVGMKNPTSGNLDVMLNSIKAAQVPHRFIYNGYEVETQGNEYAHAILRGSVNPYGRNIPNYHYENLITLAKEYSERKLANPAIIVDCNHANSAKLFYEQPRISMEVMRSKKYSSTLDNMIKGLMIESYILEGSQPIGENKFGKSITDACLGWDDTEKLIFDIADYM